MLKELLSAPPSLVLSRLPLKTYFAGLSVYNPNWHLLRYFSFFKFLQVNFPHEFPNSFFLLFTFQLDSRFLGDVQFLIQGNLCNILHFCDSFIHCFLTISLLLLVTKKRNWEMGNLVTKLNSPSLSVGRLFLRPTFRNRRVCWYRNGGALFHTFCGSVGRWPIKNVDDGHDGRMKMTSTTNVRMDRLGSWIYE